MKSRQDIIIGVSSCLLGHKVRYDGAHKFNKTVASDICAHFNCIAICPEHAIGLGVPRKPIQLVKTGQNVSLLAVGNPARDFTDPITDYANRIQSLHPKICGYIFKSRSPSCGLVDVPVFNYAGKQVEISMGRFAAQLISQHPDLPVIDETSLADKNTRQRFLSNVTSYAQTPAAR